MFTSTAFFNIKRYPMAVVLVAFVLTSCGGHKSKSPPPPQPVQSSQLGAVSPLYPNNGADWNDYVKGNDWKTAPDTACTAASDTACMHAGELRVVVATGQSSCTGLTASDDLGAFNWVCDASTNPVRLVSTGLADGKNLSDLMDFTGSGGFKTNKVTVYSNGTSWNTTPSTTWWSNPVVLDPVAASGSIDLTTTDSTIYLVTSNPHADITFWADKIALVVDPGVTISGPGANASVIKTGGYAHLWLEGKIDANAESYGVLSEGARFSMLRNLEVDNAGSGGVVLNGAVNNKLVRVTAKNNTGTGFILSNSSQNNVITDVTASNNSGDGVYLTGSTNNTITGLKAGNNAGMGVKLNASNNTLTGVTASNNSCISGINVYGGVYLSNASNNTLTGVTASNNGGSGVYLDSASKNNLMDVTASNNAYYGVYLNNSTGSTTNSTDNTLSNVTVSTNYFGLYLAANSNNNILADVTSSNNSSMGLLLYNSSHNTLENLASSGNTYYGAYLYSSASDPSNTFTGLLKIGNTGTNCLVSGTAPQGLDSSCIKNGSSDATNDSTVTLAGSFVGKVTSDDVANASDTPGAATSFPSDPTTFDWVHFDNKYRGWGFDGTTLGRWTTGTGDGRIWDWSLLLSDTTQIRGVLPLPNNGSSTITHTWSDATSATFLRNAVEIAGDGIGNDNGLCESGETCRYTPNIGSYQGRGDLISAGTIGTGGTLENITLMEYPTNGETAQ
jgi:parallel beta-helix repeat protein